MRHALLVVLSLSAVVAACQGAPPATKTTAKASPKAKVTAKPTATPPGTGTPGPDATSTPAPDATGTPGTGATSAPGPIATPGLTLAVSQVAGESNVDKDAYAAATVTGKWTARTGTEPLDRGVVDTTNVPTVGTPPAKVRKVVLTFHVKPTVGKSYEVSGNDLIAEGATVSVEETATFLTFSWRGKAGKLKIEAVEGPRVTFKLEGVEMEPVPGSAATKGTFRLDGSGTAVVIGL